MRKNGSGFGLTIGFVILIILTVLAGAGYYVSSPDESNKDQDPETKSTRETLYSYTSALSGGYCAYPIINSDGSRLKGDLVCLDDQDIEEIKDSNKSLWLNSNGAYKNDIIFVIEADTSTTKEEHSNTANPPSNSTIDVLHLERIYEVSVKQVSKQSL